MKISILTGVLFVAVLMIALPNASGTTWTFLPPWGQHTGWDNPWAINVAGNSFVATVNADGTFTMGLFTYSLPPQGAAADTAFVLFVGPEWIAPTSDYYQFTVDWKITGSAKACVYIVFPSFAVSRAAIWLQANLWDFTAQRWVYDQAVPTVTLVDMAGNTLYCAYWPYNVVNAAYTLQFSPAMLVNHRYALYTYLQFYNSASSFGLSSAHGQTFMDPASKHTKQSIYVYSGGGGGCVLSGTQVLLPGGKTRVVERLKVGDTVMGYNLSSGKLQRVSVANVTSSRETQIESINDGLLKVTTTDQPIYVRNGTWEGWVRDPSQLRVGEKLFMPQTKTWVTITKIETLVGNFLVYDVLTDPLNNFVANGVLVDRK